MRIFKKATVLLLACLVAGLGLSRFAGVHSAKPIFSVSDLNYTNFGNGFGLACFLTISNASGKVIEYKANELMVRTVSVHGLTKLNTGLRIPTVPVLCKPGCQSRVGAGLPEDTQLWQIGYKYRTANIRERFITPLPRRWRDWCTPIYNRLFQGAEHETWSEVIECPIGPHNIPPLFDAGNVSFSTGGQPNQQW